MSALFTCTECTLVHGQVLTPGSGPWIQGPGWLKLGSDCLYFALDRNVPSVALLVPACTIGRTFTCTDRTLCCLQVAAGALFTPWTCALHVSLANQRRPQKLPYDI